MTGRDWNAFEIGEVHLSHPRSGVLGAQDLLGGPAANESKVRAVADAPEPKRVAVLRLFLGLVNYYGKFLPNLATIAAPLHNLLKKNAHWTWGKSQKAAFKWVEDLLQPP